MTAPDATAGRFVEETEWRKVEIRCSGTGYVEVHEMRAAGPFGEVTWTESWMRRCPGCPDCADDALGLPPPDSQMVPR